MGKTYVASDFSRDQTIGVFLNGKEINNVVAANPSEGWLELPNGKDVRRLEGEVIVMNLETAERFP